MKSRALAPLSLLVLLASPNAAWAVTSTLSWDPAPDAEMVTGWKIYYDRDQPGPPYDGTDANEGPSPIDVPIASIADPMMPTIQISGLESCVTYWFAATAYNDAGESDFSAEVEKKVVAKPSDVMAVSNAPGEVTVSWGGPPADDPGMIPGYQIFYDLDTSGEPYSAPGSPFAVSGVTEVNLTGLTTRATYYFVVDSVCDNFASNRSDEVSVQVIAELPGQPGSDVGTQPNPPPGDDEVDMGTEPAPSGELADDGCGCRVGGRPAPSAWLGLLFAVVGVGRRKLRREHVRQRA